jgi:hypothetical protein
MAEQQMARALPGRAASIVAKAAEAALTRALDIALFSLRDQRFQLRAPSLTPLRGPPKTLISATR